ncbi:hypothetical protein AKJ16_DCAP06625 [Drosera capensis]
MLARERLLHNIGPKPVTPNIHNIIGGSNRLPRAVMLARERLLHRLGVLASGARESRLEFSTGSPRSEV